MNRNYGKDSTAVGGAMDGRGCVGDCSPYRDRMTGEIRSNQAVNASHVQLKENPTWYRKGRSHRIETETLRQIATKEIGRLPIGANVIDMQESKWRGLFSGKGDMVTFHYDAPHNVQVNGRIDGVHYETDSKTSIRVKSFKK